MSVDEMMSHLIAWLIGVACGVTIAKFVMSLV